MIRMINSLFSHSTEPTRYEQTLKENEQVSSEAVHQLTVNSFKALAKLKGQTPINSKLD